MGVLHMFQFDMLILSLLSTLQRKGLYHFSWGWVEPYKHRRNSNNVSPVQMKACDMVGCCLRQDKNNTKCVIKRECFSSHMMSVLQKNMIGWCICSQNTTWKTKGLLFICSVWKYSCPVSSSKRFFLFIRIIHAEKKRCVKACGVERHWVYLPL